MLASTRKAKEEKYGVQWEPICLTGNKCGSCRNDICVLALRHHCRKCGKVVCGACQSSTRVSVPGSANPKLICVQCSVMETTVASTHQGCVPETTDTVASISKDTVCGICNQPLGNSYVSLSNPTGKMNVHSDCFKCHADDAPITGPFNWGEDGELYCREHWTEIFCESCTGCSKKISSGVSVNALGGKWHQSCFVCTMCCTPLSCSADGGEFQFYLHNGSVSCRGCFEQHLAMKCAGCGFPVGSGKSLLAMGITWHEECFKCCECQVAIVSMENRNFRVLDGYPYCCKDYEKVCELSSEDLAVLQALPPSSGPTLKPHKSSLAPTAEERGQCLSKGIGLTVKEAKLPALKNKVAHWTLPTHLFRATNQVDLSVESVAREISFNFEAVTPEVFADLRMNAFNVSNEEFLRSIELRPFTGGTTGEGKSGSLFFFSWDKRYIVKTVEPVEIPFFRKCLLDYHTHFAAETTFRDASGTKASLLPKYMGVYKLKFEGESEMNVVVMANVFPLYTTLRERYDLKGVLGSKRFVSEEELAKGVKVLKDRNFVDKQLVVGPELKAKICTMLKNDTDFLYNHNRIDYSLLLGIANLSDVKDTPHSDRLQQWPSAECKGLQSLDGKQPGTDVFFFGIIDILQEYTFKKQCESSIKYLQYKIKHIHKESMHTTSDTAVSAMPPLDYAKRFLSFLEEHIE